MNTDQIINFIQTIFKVGGGALAAKGYGDSSQWEFWVGLITAIITYIISHKWNATPDTQGKLPLTLMLALLLPFSGLMLTGCSTSAQRVVYQTAATTQVSVETAMHLWGAYVTAKHPPIEQEQAVSDAYSKYQAAMAAVCDAGAVYAAASEKDKPSASAALEMASQNLAVEIGDLQQLIVSFGVKLN